MSSCDYALNINANLTVYSRSQWALYVIRLGHETLLNVSWQILRGKKKDACFLGLISKRKRTNMWQNRSFSWGLCSIGYLSETYLQLKSREALFARELFHSGPIFLKFCTDYVQNFKMSEQLTIDLLKILQRLCTKFQDEWRTQMDVVGRQDFEIFEFKVSLWRVSYIA